jgi:hypothetical protein
MPSQFFEKMGVAAQGGGRWNSHTPLPAAPAQPISLTPIQIMLIRNFVKSI